MGGSIPSHSEAAQSASPGEGVCGGVTTHCNFGPQEIVDWFNALRAARFHYLQVAFPGASDADVSGCPKVTLQGRGVGREVATWDRSQD